MYSLRELPEPLPTNELKHEFDRLELIFPATVSLSSSLPMLPTNAQQQASRLQEIFGVAGPVDLTDSDSKTKGTLPSKDEWLKMLKDLIDRLPAPNYNIPKLASTSFARNFE